MATAVADDALVSTLNGAEANERIEPAFSCRRLPRDGAMFSLLLGCLDARAPPLRVEPLFDGAVAATTGSRGAPTPFSCFPLAPTLPLDTESTTLHAVFAQNAWVLRSAMQ